MAIANAQAVRASDKVTIHLNLLPHRLTMESGQQYDRLLAEMFKNDASSVVFRPAPLKRAGRNFIRDVGSCSFPTNERALRAGQKVSDVRIIVSDPVDVASMRLYTTQKASALIQVGDFLPERVAYIRGSGAVAILGSAANGFMAISSEKQLIQMLELGRIDAFLGHHPDTALALNDLKRPGALHVSPIPIKNLSFPISFICHETDQTKALLERVNMRLEDMRSDGRLREILGQYADLGTQESPEESAPLTD
ncbi:MAG: transporter substrate-binding domain-containing protein [Roseibium sp.]